MVEFLPFVNRPEGQKNIGLALGQNIYAPRDIEAPNPDPSDRPYAGWSYLELAFVSKTRSIADIISFQIGLIGPHSQAEDSQRIICRWTAIASPLGWDYQLRDEIGLNMIFERRWRLYSRHGVHGRAQPLGETSGYHQIQTKDRIMNARSIPENWAMTLVVVNVVGRTTYSLATTTYLAGVHPELLRYYCQLGLFGETSASKGDGLVFDDDALYELRRFEQYRQDHDIKRSTLRLICSLWQRIERLETELRFLRNS